MLIKLFAGFAVTVSLVGCGSESTAPAENKIACSEAIPVNEDANDQTKQVLAQLMDYSCDAITGVLVGQNAGHGSQIADASHEMSYAQLVQPLVDQTGSTPAVLAVDYGYDEIYTLAELQVANVVLKNHWDNGGLVSVGWSPHSPWVNDAADPENNPGDGSETRTGVAGQNDRVVLKDLLDSTTDVYGYWHNQLDIIAAGLQALQNVGVTVLWRPMQEMNGTWFWWGTNEAVNDSQSYIDVWQNMYQYLTVEKGLNNLLWVYAPTNSTYFSAMDRYPGTDYVDVIAGTTYDDALYITNYNEYLSYGKPLAISEYGPGLSEFGGTGTLDNTMYIDTLSNDYPAAAYWVSWHSYYYVDANGDTQKEKLAIIDNDNVQALMDAPAIITLEKFVRQ